MHQTTAPNFVKSSFSVLRRYSDFLWLYEALSANNPGIIVPPVPDKNSLSVSRFESAFVEGRRFALEKCVTKMANHPVLSKDADFKFFLESDSFALDVSLPPQARRSMWLILLYWSSLRSSTGGKRILREQGSWLHSGLWQLLGSMKLMRSVC